MKTRVKKTVRTIALLALCLTLGFCVLACVNNNEPPASEPQPPVKVADGIDLEVATGKSKKITIADYITVNDYTASATSDSANATATIAEGLLTVTGVTEGSAKITLSCGDVTVDFGVTVFTEYTVTVDGKATVVKKGEQYTLPDAPTIADPNLEFDYWLVGTEHKQPGDSITVNSNTVVTSATKRKAPVKVKDGGAVTAPLGAVKNIPIAEYITAYGAEVTAESSDEDKVTASVTNVNIVLTPVAEGDATVTVTCGNVSVEFAVTVSAAPVTYTVTVDGEVAETVNAGETYTLPSEPAVPNDNFRFVAWVVNGEEKQPGETITVNSDLVITQKIERKAPEKIKDGDTVKVKFDGEEAAKTATRTVSDYIDLHGATDVTVTATSQNEAVATATLNGDTLTVTAVAEGDTTVTLSCGNITVTFTVKVTSVNDGTPEFEDGSISFDLFSATSGYYDFVINAPQGSNFSYAYTADPGDGVDISDGRLTYEATTTVTDYVITVNVTATDATLGTKTTSFSVTVNVTNTTPVASNSVVNDSTVHDLYDGALNIDLTDNIDNTANHNATYKVNGAEVVDPTAYAVTGNYTEDATDVVLNVVAAFGTVNVSYTYNLKVKNTSAYRIANGGFDKGDDGLEGWTLTNNVDGKTIGEVNDKTLYWNEKAPFNADGNFFNAYKNSGTADDEEHTPIATGGDEDATGTLTSSTFKIGGSGWMTYKLGGAKNINDVYMEVVRTSDNKAVKLPNYDWTDADKMGCSLRAYKVNLLDFCGFSKGDSVFIRVTDNATSDYGLFFVDSFVTYYDSEPDGNFSLVTKYRLYNGSFESGLSGWTLDGDLGYVLEDELKNADWYQTNEDTKDGKKLFTFVDANGNNKEVNSGKMRSSLFTLKKNGIISFRMGAALHSSVYIKLCKDDGTELALFRNNSYTDATKMVHYYYQCNNAEEIVCYFEMCDDENAGGDYRCIVMDDFRVNLDAAPDGAVLGSDKTKAELAG